MNEELRKNYQNLLNVSGTGLFGLADSVRAVSVTELFGQTITSCRNLTC